MLYKKDSTMELYKAINKDAKFWWVNRELREQGKDKAARLRERETIKQRVQDLRLAIKVGAYITIGNFSSSLNFGEYRTGPDSTTSKWISGLNEDLLRAIAKSCNIPVLEMKGKSSKAYNLLMKINPDLSNLMEIKSQIESMI